MKKVKNSNFFTSVYEAVQAIHNNHFKAVELAESCVERYKEIESKVHAWVIFRKYCSTKQKL